MKYYGIPSKIDKERRREGRVEGGRERRREGGKERERTQINNSMEKGE